VTRVIPNPPQLGALGANLFPREERGRVEIGQPRSNLLASASYDIRRLTLTAARSASAASRASSP
jgi:hypothetical protein